MLHAKKNGVVVSMTTNGILLTDEKLSSMHRTLDWITLSLDSSDPVAQHLLGRVEGHCERTIGLLKTIKENYTYKVKINTIASKCNVEDVIELAPIIQKHQINRW